MKSKTQLAKEIIEKYIEIGVKENKQYSKRYLGIVLYNENPSIFKDSEDARTYIRTSLNSHGERNRVKSKEDLSKRFALIPEALKEVENSDPFTVQKSIKKTLWIADVHGRFYDKNAFEIAINYGIKENCDSVIILGDFLDFYGDSKFDKNPSLAYVFEEQEWGQDVLKLLQDTFGYVVLKQGNHDVRREKHIERLSAKKPELMGMAKYDDYLFFDGCNVKFVEDYKHIIYGKLNGIHGHEYYGGGGIHIAYNRLHKTFDNTISAHSHRSNSVISKAINNDIYGSWTIGCLCNLFARYAPKNNWNNGFAITEKDSKGDFEVNNRSIFGKKTYHS